MRNGKEKRTILIGIAVIVAILLIVGGISSGKKELKEKSSEDNQSESYSLENNSKTQEESSSIAEVFYEETSKEIEEASKETTTSKEQENEARDNWVSKLKIASSVSQMVIVRANGSNAEVSMHNKTEDGSWTEIIKTQGFVGIEGVGATSEYASKTPEGVYLFTKAFGIMPNPGTEFSYVQVDESYYWVDDMDSKYYNKFVSTNEVTKDWDSAEQIAVEGETYNYVLAFDYNSECVPGDGSAFFLHCSFGEPTEGCITVPENEMINILKNLRKGCVIVIGNESDVCNF